MYKTPLIIKETLGQEIYDLVEKIRNDTPPPESYHITMSPTVYDAFNKALEDECKHLKYFKKIKE